MLDAVAREEVGVAKPDPAIYRMVFDRLGVAPGETVFLDDREEAADGARAVGTAAVVFRDDAQAMAEIEALLVPAP